MGRLVNIGTLMVLPCSNRMALQREAGNYASRNSVGAMVAASQTYAPGATHRITISDDSQIAGLKQNRANEPPTQRTRAMQHARNKQPAAKKETLAKPARSASDSGLRHDLTELSADIRAYRQRIHAVAHCSLPSCTDGESPGLAGLLDRWIMQATGRNQLILLACATELGVIKWRHLEAGGHTLSRLDCRALRALYWATVRRWQGSKAQGKAGQA